MPKILRGHRFQPRVACSKIVRYTFALVINDILGEDHDIKAMGTSRFYWCGHFNLNRVFIRA